MSQQPKNGLCEEDRGELMSQWTVPKMDVAALLAGVPTLGFAPTGKNQREWYVGMPNPNPSPLDLYEAKSYLWVLLGSEPWGVLNAIDVGDSTVIRLYWLRGDTPNEERAAYWKATMETALTKALDTVGIGGPTLSLQAANEQGTGPIEDDHCARDEVRVMMAGRCRMSLSLSADGFTKWVLSITGLGEAPMWLQHKIDRTPDRETTCSILFWDVSDWDDEDCGQPSFFYFNILEVTPQRIEVRGDFNGARAATLNFRRYNQIVLDAIALWDGRATQLPDSEYYLADLAPESVNLWSGRMPQPPEDFYATDEMPPPASGETPAPINGQGKRVRKSTLERREKVKELYAKGYTATAMADALGAGESTIRADCGELGLKL